MIPSFSHSGVLPPFTGQAHETHRRSPYAVSMRDVAIRFAGSEPRREILRGLVRYRQGLREIGVESGFQWLDGSFVEDVERTRRRPPGDIDVVTFAHRPAGASSDEAWGRLVMGRLDLFEPSQSRHHYSCDAYFVDLRPDKPEWLVRMTTYWSGLFSHQRDTSLWKGMIQVDLADDADLDDLLGKSVDD